MKPESGVLQRLNLRFAPPDAQAPEISIELEASINSFVDNSLENVPLDETAQDHGILSKIVTGLDGQLTSFEAQQLFKSLSVPQADRAVIIIQSLTKLDSMWTALTRLRPFDRDRLPRVQVMLSQATGALPNHLQVRLKPWNRTDVIHYGGQMKIYRLTMDGRRVALRAIHIHESTEENTKEDLERKHILEAIMWSGLRHPNILPLLGLDFQAQDSTLSLVSPWLDNGNVIKYMKDMKKNLSTTPSTEQLNKWITNILSGLTYLHKNNVIHGDLRGNNILIAEDGTALIGDFGLSVFNGDTSNNYYSNRGDTKRFSAPEILSPEKFEALSRSGRPTFKSDVYSFGCLCYQLYTQRVPFYEHINDLVAMRMADEGKRPARMDGSVLPNMSDQLWELVGRAWTHQPLERPTAQELYEELQKII